MGTNYDPLIAWIKKIDQICLK